CDQATVSRDIKELCLLKKPTAGGSRYTAPAKEGFRESVGRVHSIFHSAVKTVDYAMHTIVIHTLPGMADAAAITLESMEWPEILGTIAGDDTVLVILRDGETAARIAGRLSEMLK
ncbi:MAG: arginine repressor, partial [Ruminococcaceae bacterium]|nr:arginine repressor [Oscillospiraceae bacterium]